MLEDSIIRLILFLTLLTLTLYWKYKSPFTLIEWLKTILNPQGIITLFVEFILFLQLFNMLAIDFIYTPWNFVIKYIGLAIFLCAASLAIWAKKEMGHSWGIPAQHDIKRQNKLVTTGPFAYSRNPIYVGLLLIFLGFELALLSLLVILIVPIVLIVLLAVKKEELLLEEHFGNEYHIYKSRVPRFLKFLT